MEVTPGHHHSSSINPIAASTPTSHSKAHGGLVTATHEGNPVKQNKVHRLNTVVNMEVDVPPSQVPASALIPLTPPQSARSPLAVMNTSHLQEEQNLIAMFQSMSTFSQDRFLMILATQGFCTKKQLSLLANAALPQLRLDVLRHLPHELALHVLSYLPVRTLCRLACSSRFHRSIVMDNHLWRSLCKQQEFLDERYRFAMGVKRAYLPQDENRPGNVRKPDFLAMYRLNHAVQCNWHEGSYKQISIPGPVQAIVTSLQFDEERLVIATDNATFGLIEIYDSRTGVHLCQLKEHEGGVWALEFQGNTLLSGGCDRDLRYVDSSIFFVSSMPCSVWDLQHYRLRYRLVGHTSTIRCMKMLDEGRCVTGSRDNTIRIWDIKHGTCLNVLR